MLIGPLATAMVSLDMLFWTEGQQYTKEKLYEMLSRAGFTSVACTETIGYWSITTGVKP